MKNYLAMGVLLIAFLANSCTNAQNSQKQVNYQLTPSEFAQKIKELPKAPLIDVRTPQEYSGGHINDAKNINWTGNDFDQQIKNLDKSKPVLVYCLSGGRSGAAAKKMRAEGFKEVYELKGGIMNWRSDNMPLTTAAKAKPAGMDKDHFNKLIDSDKLVLVDFYADWCAPCKKMEPYLREIAAEQADRVLLVRINADENPGLCKQLGIDALPVLQVYKDQHMQWSHKGYMDKEAILKQIQP